MTTQFEYIWASQPRKLSDNEYLDKLNQFGERGWEVIHVEEDNSDAIFRRYLFKRERVRHAKTL